MYIYEHIHNIVIIYVVFHMYRIYKESYGLFFAIYSILCTPKRAFFILLYPQKCNILLPMKHRTS